MFEDNMVRNVKFSVRLLIESDWLMFSCAPECSKQLPLRKYIANWKGLGVSYRCYNLSKTSFREGTTLSENRYTSPKIADGHLVRARCRVKVALRHSCVVVRMRTLVRHMHDVCAIHISGIVCTVTRSSSWCNC